MSLPTKIYRGIGITLAVLASVGLVISSMPLSFFRAPTPPPENSRSDSPSTFSFEIADTPELREQGLSGRSEIPQNSGMLFVFDEPGEYGFWMKDMNMPIDIIWISEAGIILGSAENVAPDSYPETFYPPAPVLYVLETRPGEARAQGWNTGDSIPLP